MIEQHVSDIYPAPVTLLGKRLAPLSLGHVFLLQRFGCYPVNSYSGLITAVLICSRPCADVMPTLADRFLGFKLRVWAWRLGAFDPYEKIVAFNEYLQEHSRRPELLPFDSFEETGLPGAPFLQHLRVTLLARCGWTPAMIDTEPLAQAHWDYYTYWEIEDRVRILSAQAMGTQLDLVADADAKHAERLAKAGGHLSEQSRAREQAVSSGEQATSPLADARGSVHPLVQPPPIGVPRGL